LYGTRNIAAAVGQSQKITIWVHHGAWLSQYSGRLKTM
jgi:hypothetical protein